ncbi:macrophage mannose receptor 1-like isoform X2 [Vanacampus margaritifer]
MEAPNGWLGARQHCVWECGDLVSIASEEENHFVKKEMGGRPFWIGLSNLNCKQLWCQYEAGKQNLTWSDTRRTATYADWAQGQDGSSNVRSCVYVNRGKWTSGPCESPWPYMCERAPDGCLEGRTSSCKRYGSHYNGVETSSCDPGNLLYGDFCYHVEYKQKNWWVAEEFCQGLEGHLASVHSEDEVTFLLAHISPPSEESCFWLGLANNNNKKLRWTDRTPVKTDAIPWEEGHGPTTVKDCAVLLPSGKVLDTSCYSDMSFICKKARVPGPPDVLGPPGCSAKCGCCWLENHANDFCYLINLPNKTWEDARDDCVRHGGDLLSIADSHEQTFIQGLYAFLRAADSLWLGANVTIAEDGGKWIDGSPFSYVHLNAEDAPDGRCLSILTANGRWKFDDCRKKNGYICKRRGSGTSPEPPRPHDGFTERLICQNSHQDLLSCQGEDQDERVIRIQSAFYGRRSADVCPTDEGSDGRCAVEGVLAHYRNECDNRQKCHVWPLKDESCPAVSKYLQMVYSCEPKVCLDTLGVANGSIANWQLTASSSMSNFTPKKGRLNGKSCWKPSQDGRSKIDSEPSAWRDTASCSSSSMMSDAGSWIQVNLGHMRMVRGIQTKGCYSTSYRSWSFNLEMKLSVDGRSWTSHPSGQFVGGGTRVFGAPVSARYVRILPLENGLNSGLRFDILGCALADVRTTCGSKFNSLRLTDPETFHCPAGCANRGHKVFGTLIYDEDSSICAAAIHAGAIVNEMGGDVTVMNAPERKASAGSTRNGIASRRYDDSTASAFTFADGESRCSGADWAEFAGFCYKPFEDQKTWLDAQYACRDLGAELVSIRSKVEQAWVQNLLKSLAGPDTKSTKYAGEMASSGEDTSHMWTGLNDLVDRGRFLWSDRQIVTFTNWAPGEPQHRAGLDEDCVAMLQKTGRWRQMKCAQVNRFLCKMAKAHRAVKDT